MATDFKTLYSQYEEANAHVEECRVAVETAIAKRSDAVKAIAEFVAPVKSITVNGQELAIICREPTYFFRAKKAGKSFEV